MGRSYHTTVMGAMTPMEGMHYYSNTPFTRPLLTFIKDTVDIEKIRERHGPTGAHSFIYNSGRCTSGIYELAYDVANHNSCDLNLKQGLVEALGEEHAKLFHYPGGLHAFPGREVRQNPAERDLSPSADFYQERRLCRAAGPR